MEIVNERIDEMSAKLYDEAKRSSKRSTRGFSSLRTDLLELMEDYSNKNGKISKARIRTLLNELDVFMVEIENEFNELLDVEIERVSSEYARDIVSAFGPEAAAEINLNDLTEDIREYIYNREINGATLTDRTAALAGSIRDDMQKVIRNNILLGAAATTIILRVKDSMDKTLWRVDTIFMTEILTTFRTAIAFIGGALGLVKGIKIVDRRGRHPNHESHQCYKYAEQDRYGMGKGVFLPRDTYILNPHPQCTAYFHYVLHEKGAE